MAADENRALARRLWEVWNTGNLDLIDELLPPTFIHHGPPEVEGEVRGPADYKQLVTLCRTAMPDLQVTPEAMIAEENLVVTGWTAHGTLQGMFRGLAPTGQPVRVVGVAILYMAEGKIAEERISYDALGLLRQFGMSALPGEFMPPSEPADQELGTGLGG